MRRHNHIAHHAALADSTPRASTPRRGSGRRRSEPAHSLAVVAAPTPLVVVAACETVLRFDVAALRRELDAICDLYVVRTQARSHMCVDLRVRRSPVVCARMRRRRSRSSIVGCGYGACRRGTRKKWSLIAFEPEGGLQGLLAFGVDEIFLHVQRLSSSNKSNPTYLVSQWNVVV